MNISTILNEHRITHKDQKYISDDNIFWKCKLLSGIWFSVTPWTVAHHVPRSVEFSSQEYRSGLPFPSPGDLPHPGIQPRSPALQADSFLTEPPGKPAWRITLCFKKKLQKITSLLVQWIPFSNFFLLWLLSERMVAVVVLIFCPDFINVTCGHSSFAKPLYHY